VFDVILFAMANRNVVKRKTQEKKQINPALPVPVVSNAGEVPSVYSNFVEILSMNHLDVRLAFNEVAVETGNQVKSFRRANIVLSVPAFMHMLQILNVNAQVLAARVPQEAAAADASIRKDIEAGLSRLALPGLHRAAGA
jgi:hypothetical protein